MAVVIHQPWSPAIARHVRAVLWCTQWPRPGVPLDQGLHLTALGVEVRRSPARQPILGSLSVATSTGTSATTHSVIVPTCAFNAAGSTQKSNVAGDSPPPQRLLRNHSVETPINVSRLARLLNRYSDHSFSHFVLHGLCHVFTIGHSAAIAGCVRKRELASLLGHLSFASRAIPAARTFLRRLYDLDKATSEMSSHRMLHLSASAKGDLSWWHQTLSTWNRESFFLLKKWMPSADLQSQTDASGTIGLGAFFNGRWFRGDWSPQQLELSITYKELFAIVVACATWGIEWLRVEFQCDNQAAVECLKTGTSRSPAVMALIRTLYSICVKHNFLIRASYLPGISNTIADALSRNKMDAFRTFAPTAAVRPDTMVQPITAWVINRSCSTQADPPTRMGHKPLLLSAGRPTWSYTALALGRPTTRFVNAHSIEASYSARHSHSS